MLEWLESASSKDLKKYNIKSKKILNNGNTSVLLQHKDEDKVVKITCISDEEESFFLCKNKKGFVKTFKINKENGLYFVEMEKLKPLELDFYKKLEKIVKTVKINQDKAYISKDLKRSKERYKGVLREFKRRKKSFSKKEKKQIKKIIETWHKMNDEKIALTDFKIDHFMVDSNENVVITDIASIKAA